MISKMFSYKLVLLLVISISGIAIGDISVFPRPQSIKAGSGIFQISQETDVCATGDAVEVAKYLADIMRQSTGYGLDICSKVITADKYISLEIDSSVTGGNEAYELDVTNDNVSIRAATPAGLFYGVQTLRQLLPPEIESQTVIKGKIWVVPTVKIKDQPRFKWRGMHLDVCRHIFPVESVKRYIDLMAMYKFNTFHWHLTEDQGWRIEIKKYPRLVEIGSKRESTPIPSNRDQSDGKPYGGYYTQEQIREVVDYAARRYITVVPEIEMPGHSIAALTAYPELGCTGGPYKVRTKWGVEEDVYCAGNEQVFGFLEDVLDEVLELFPSKIIHIGGDECPKNRWQQCPKCQLRMKENNLADEHALQSYFITRIEKYLNSKDRQIIGWDEILEGGLAPNAMVMSWRGIDGGIAAARDGHNVVMSPVTHCYFDYYQSQDQASEPPAFGGFLPLEQVYSYEPVPEELNENQKKYIVGVQANIWTEYIPIFKQVEYMAYPRAIALSEVAWSIPSNKDYNRFLKTLKTELKRLDLLEVNYRRLSKE